MVAMDLISRCNKFLDELGIPVTSFSCRVKLSPQSLYDWKKGKLKLSDVTLKRIDEYLKKYGF